MCEHHDQTTDALGGLTTAQSDHLGGASLGFGQRAQ
jgi:hypothetical protein